MNCSVGAYRALYNGNESVNVKQEECLKSFFDRHNKKYLFLRLTKLYKYVKIVDI